MAAATVTSAVAAALLFLLWLSLPVSLLKAVGVTAVAVVKHSWPHGIGVIQGFSK